MLPNFPVLSDWIHQEADRLNLIIDIGNTRSKIGVFKNEEMVHTTIWQKGWSLEKLKRFLRKYEITHAALSTVAGVSSSIEALLSECTHYLKLSYKTPLPIQNAYKSPKTLGRDRLAAVVGAYSLYPDEACLVIDAGTCITYDLIDRDRVYQGGNISPGLEMRFRAMHEFTAGLPLLKRRHHSGLIGQSTKSAMRTGSQWGCLFEIDGFITQYRRQFGKLRVVMTGGSADYLANHLKTKIFVHPNLVLEGLNEILNYNVQTLD
ncbi:MAG: type III pantothenate kinase [Bacteroidota bacterium]